MPWVCTGCVPDIRWSQNAWHILAVSCVKADCVKPGPCDLHISSAYCRHMGGNEFGGHVDTSLFMDPWDRA